MNGRVPGHSHMARAACSSLSSLSSSSSSCDRLGCPVGAEGSLAAGVFAPGECIGTGCASPSCSSSVSCSSSSSSALSASSSSCAWRQRGAVRQHVGHDASRKRRAQSEHAHLATCPRGSKWRLISRCRAPSVRGCLPSPARPCRCCCAASGGMSPRISDVLGYTRRASLRTGCRVCL